MGRFNTQSVGTQTTNLAGGKAFSEDPKLELVSILLTSFCQDQYYRTGDETIEVLRKLIHILPDPKFVAKAALFARNEFGMRSITHVAAGEIAKLLKGGPWTSTFFQKVFSRPDDILETFAYYISKYGKRPIPNSLKRGARKKLVTLDEHTLAKYKGEGKEVNMRDVINLVHPTRTPAIHKLMTEGLASTGTWEVKLSAAGQVAETEEEKLELKKDAWAELLGKNRLGYMALLKNLRNIIEQAPDSVELACERLTNKQAIHKSKVLPFRYLTAFEEISKLSGSHVRTVITALSQALDSALDNCPELPGRTLIALDTSGSMLGKPLQIGSLFAAILFKRCRADIITFSTDAQYRNYVPHDSAMSIAKQLQDLSAYGGTDFRAVFGRARGQYNRIIFLSDMQGWVGYQAPTAVFEAWKRINNCNPNVISIDLAGHGTLQFPQNNVYCLAGFSEKIFEIMKFLEQDRHALIKRIEAVEI